MLLRLLCFGFPHLIGGRILEAVYDDWQEKQQFPLIIISGICLKRIWCVDIEVGSVMCIKVYNVMTTGANISKTLERYYRLTQTSEFFLLIV